MRGFFLLLFLTSYASLVWSPLAYSQTTKKSPESLEEEDEDYVSSSEIYLEETRKTVSARVFRLADKIDSLFGDRRYDDRRNKSTLRVGERFFYKDGTTGAENPEVTLNLYLPNLQKIMDRFKSSIAETIESGDAQSIEPGAYNRESPWDLNTESGLVVANPLNYYGRLRLRRDFLIEKTNNSFYVQVGWSKSNEWEQQMAITTDYAINRDLLFRFLNQEDWSMTNETLGTTHGPSLLQQISEVSAISYDLRYITAIENDAIYSKRAFLGATYRRQLDMKWIFIEINPELAWERETNFKPLYNFFFKVEFFFGHI
ncbi:hypothetical protein QJS83_16530 [Bdellovibrio sp. 22V]|uniref:hypothetical protein n=1 Tax=Bdellovibrio sp. 22V TaxID=3044166 RepID=UPI002543D189|nr:hypothetical protein [Bdellovibrio sp. 22V]WII72069.1 hypothetical protein QJS83_16530 [Bdellovibrio sp. 22V]